MAMPDEIADYLALQSDGVVGTTIFVHRKPPLPLASISVHQFSLGLPITVMDGTIKCEQPGLQIQVRDVTGELAEATCLKIFKQLASLGLANLSIGGTWYIGIVGRKPPVPLSIDQFSVTYYCECAVIKQLSA